MNTRFTIDGSDALENHLEQICARVRSGVQTIIPSRELEAVLLGGGYGRGEGGVLKTEHGELPYNDLEFYVFLRNISFLKRRKYRHYFHILAEKLSAEAGLEIEFELISIKKFRQSPPTMFFYDLIMGHRLILGKNVLISENAHRAAEQIPLFEATRLLMNRCSGLLFAQERLLREPFTVDDADFVGRNQAKAQLCFGDVLLTAVGQYHWSCRERNKRLEAIANILPPDLPLSQIYCHHSRGLEFKLHPKKKTGSRETFCSMQAELCSIGFRIWLWLESRRLNYNFTSAKDYALSILHKCPETNPFKNRLINARTFGPWVLAGRTSVRYPRERLLNSLALLLWEQSCLNETSLLKKLQSDLRTNTATFAGFVQSYHLLWKKFN